MRFEDGSFATVNYLDNGPNSFPKERIEVFTARRALALENFRRLVGYNWPGFKRLSAVAPGQGAQRCGGGLCRRDQEGTSVADRFRGIGGSNARDAANRAGGRAESLWRPKRRLPISRHQSACNGHIL